MPGHVLLGKPGRIILEMEMAGFRGVPVDRRAPVFTDGFGMLGDTVWEMEKAAFGEARVTGARLYLLMVSVCLATPFGRWKRIILEMEWQVLGGSRLTGARLYLLMVSACLATPFGRWKRIILEMEMAGFKGVPVDRRAPVFTDGFGMPGDTIWEMETHHFGDGNGRF